MSIFFQRASKSARSLRRWSTLARDQSRIPPGRSIRGTSSPLNGAYFARHFQKSSASLSSESVCCARTSEVVPSRRSTIQKSFTPMFLICILPNDDHGRRFVGPIHRSPQISNRDDHLGRGVDFRDSDENCTKPQAEQRVLHRAGLPETISLVNFGGDFALLCAFGPLR